MNPYSLISEGDNTVQTQFWVLGIYERNTGGLQCFVLGNNRTTANITPILTSNVSTHPRNPTIFYTNGAAFYYFVNKRGYERRIFNHSVGFGSGEDTTDHIEFLWSQLKSQRRFNGAINEVSWRVKNRHNHLETLFSNLKRENYQQSNKETLIKYNFSQ